jgi:hypothetical protein
MRNFWPLLAIVHFAIAQNNDTVLALVKLPKATSSPVPTSLVALDYDTGGKKDDKSCKKETQYIKTTEYCTVTTTSTSISKTTKTETSTCTVTITHVSLLRFRNHRQVVGHFR